MLGAIAFFAGVTTAILVLREPTEPLTAAALEAARQRWLDADVRDYDLRYRMHGGVYEVTVRDRIVTDVQLNGRPASSADFRAYGVHGWFDILEMELENLSDPGGPFAGREQSMLMRVRFHAELGLVERYLRSSGGVGRSVAVELIEFTRAEP